MDYAILKNKVDEIMDKAKPYDEKVLDEISDELGEIATPICEEMEILGRDENVAQYINLQKQFDYVRRQRSNLSSYYPK